MFLSVTNWIFKCCSNEFHTAKVSMEHWWNTPYSPSSTHCSYQKDKWLKPGSLPKAIAPSELGEQ